VLVEPPLLAAVVEPPVFVLPPVVLEPPVLVLPPLLAVVVETPLLPPAAEELPPLALLPADAELPPLGVLLVLDVAEEPPRLELVLAVELPPVAPLPPESLEHDMTSAGRPTHKVAKSIFLIGEPPNRELRTGDTRTSKTCESRDASADVCIGSTRWFLS
jgi:hypothetical protein